MSGAFAEADSGGLLTRLAHSLHEICQPLTALQCRLEIEQMEREGAPPGSVDRTLAECLRECERMNERVDAMRALVRTAMDLERTYGCTTERTEKTGDQA